jgi:hypothetical protein
MEHSRVNLMTMDPAKVDDVSKFLEDVVQPQVRQIPGNLGMALMVNPEPAVMVVESFWVSGDAMRVSEGETAPLRKEAVRRGVATVSVERHEVASARRVVRPHPGAGVRITRADVDPRKVGDAITGYEDAALPWLLEADGFCSAILLVHRRTGRALVETIWRDPDALAASRGAAAQIRADGVAAADAEIRALEEFHLAFSSAPH